MTPATDIDTDDLIVQREERGTGNPAIPNVRAADSASRFQASLGNGGNILHTYPVDGD